MNIVLSNTIENYNQLSDSLKTMKLNDYLSDKRNKIHESIYTIALNSLIDAVNKALSEILESVTDDGNYIIPKGLDNAVATICSKILEIYVDPDIKTNVIWDDDGTNRNDEKYRLDWVNSKNHINADDTSKKYWENIKLGNNNALLVFNKGPYQFIEYKNKNWLNPSNVLIVFSQNLVQLKTGNYTRLIIGPVSLEGFWKTEYIDTNNINKFDSEEPAKYVVENVNYVSGNCTMYDKINNNLVNIDLDNINDLKIFEYNSIGNDYSEMFHIKRITK